MPRRPRLHIADYPHHIIQRGHNRAACFFADEDYQAYLHWLGDGVQKTGIQLHAYVLMTNHVHLLLTPKAAEDIPRLIIRVPVTVYRIPYADPHGWPVRRSSAARTCQGFGPVPPPEAESALHSANASRPPQRRDRVAQARR
ncbi:transposase [Thiorhodovibrio frisius]|uniref:Transposase n=1 Tax=Thiorhodovibrio frisius TaxID=631362 RepID=H8YVW3_9GAMM|nr:transposase [Thiorhodovibrio frisius]EIC23754.1 transposase [Thiorhodovibrio frisius]WPL20163.1 Transposase [Thiorhodovibrio frisius]